MAAEAEKLINISLTKIAKSRAQRGGVSLHRNLLVATVLQKARFVFMEEAYHMVQRHDSDSELPTDRFEEEQQKLGVTELDFEVRDHIASEVVDEKGDESADDSRIFPVDDDDSDKENQLSHELYCKSELESRIREDGSILREKLETNPYVCSPSTSCSISPVSPQSSLKRRRAVVTEWETEEAVFSILPKKVKRGEEFSEECEESSFLDEVVTVLPFTQTATEEEVTSMDIDRITSLVSIFSFGGLTTGKNPEVLSGGVVLGGSGESISKLTRSVSTPDLCSSQAKEGSHVDVMQRPFLAMTV